MLLIWIFTFLSLCSFFKTRGINLTCSEHRNIGKHDATCYRTENNCNDTTTTLKVAWNYVDLDTGRVNISILGNSCLPPDYKLNLYRYENFGENSCRESNKELILNKCLEGNNCSPEGLKQHSYRHINQSGDIPCEQVQNVTFAFIYSGTYMFEILKEPNTELFYSDPVCFNTTFKKESMYNQKIDIFSKYVPDWNSMQHTVRNFSRLHVNHLKLEAWQNNSEHTECNGMKIADLNIYFKAHDVECYYMSGTTHKCRLNVEEGNDRIDCSIDNVTAGNHCLKVVLGHDPCREHDITVWEDKVFCSMTGKTAKVTPVDKVADRIASKVPLDIRAVIVVSVLCLVFVIATSILVKYLHNRWRQINNTNGLQPGVRELFIPMVDIPLPASQPQVFLIYARDCPAFMETMVIIRNLLKAINCKVYDCFDMDFSEEIAQIGSCWPGKYISKEDVKVLLFETRCAKLHYEAHIENLKIAYQEPTPLDDYFICSLKSLIQHPEYTSYDKVYVACVTGFTTEEDKLKITPYTRYDIPDAINDLMTSLCQPHGVTFPKTWDCSLLMLEEAVKNLEKYMTNNEDYLQQFLMRTEVSKFRRFISKFRLQ